MQVFPYTGEQYGEKINAHRPEQNLEFQKHVLYLLIDVSRNETSHGGFVSLRRFGERHVAHTVQPGDFGVTDTGLQQLRLAGRNHRVMRAGHHQHRTANLGQLCADIEPVDTAK